MVVAGPARAAAALDAARVRDARRVLGLVAALGADLAGRAEVARLALAALVVREADEADALGLGEDVAPRGPAEARLQAGALGDAVAVHLELQIPEVVADDEVRVAVAVANGLGEDTVVANVVEERITLEQRHEPELRSAPLRRDPPVLDARLDDAQEAICKF